MALCYCQKCHKNLDEKEFYTTKRKDKYPTGKLPYCKKCATMHVDNWNPDTYKWILEEVDVPYIKEEWDKILEDYVSKNREITSLSILGRYLAKMRIKQYVNQHWEDSEKIEEERKNAKIVNMRAAGLDEETIESELALDLTPQKPASMNDTSSEVDSPDYVDPSEIHDEFSDQLTEEDKLMLKLKWGPDYRPSEWVRMEQLYNDMMNSYDIQGAGRKDTLVMICKASLKTNQLLDAGDIDGAQKMAKMYDSLMKSGNFTAAQNKEQQGDFVDAIGALVAICEKDGFIPRLYVERSQDKVDQTLVDYQQYAHTLVTEEMNLGNMIESSLKEIMKDKEREAHIDVDDSSGDEDDDIMDYHLPEELTEEDYNEYHDMIEEGLGANEEDE